MRSVILRMFMVLILSPATISGCGLTVTKERPNYQDLDPPEKDAVQIILRELRAFNEQVKQKLPPHNIEGILDEEHISVSFEELIFSWNFGDNLVHVSVWENLSSSQQQLVQSWFKSSTIQDAQQIYEKLFYEFMSVVQGAKQFMYNTLSAAWVFGHRTVFAIERDSIETALAHYEAENRQAEMWGFLDASCVPVIEQYEPSFGDKFTKDYFNSHFAELASPDDPSGYMYFICRWIAFGKADLAEYNFNLQKMLQWLKDLPN